MGMDEFGKWLITLGVGGVLAGMMFMFYRKDIKQYTELWQTQAELNRKQTEMLVGVIKEQAISNVQLTSAVEALHRRLDEGGFPRHVKQARLVE